MVFDTYAVPIQHQSENGYYSKSKDNRFCCVSGYKNTQGYHIKVCSFHVHNPEVIVPNLHAGFLQTKAFERAAEQSVVQTNPDAKSAPHSP